MVHDLTEVCFAHRLVPTAQTLAEAIGQAFRDLAPTDTGLDEEGAGEPRGADDGIADELERVGVDENGEDAARVTVRLKAPPSGPEKASVARPTAPTKIVVPQGRRAATNELTVRDGEESEAEESEA